MASTVNLTWNAISGATGYTVQYKKQSSGTWITPSSSPNPTTNLFYAIPNLEDGTPYDFSVKTQCNSSEAGAVTIQGTTPCKPVTGLGSSFSGTTATLTFNRIPEASSYMVYYRLNGAGNYSAAPNAPVANPGSGSQVTFNITGLAEGSTYEFAVVTNCVAGTSTSSLTTSSSSCPSVTGFQLSFS
jgi:hypothetical protein